MQPATGAVLLPCEVAALPATTNTTLMSSHFEATRTSMREGTTTNRTSVALTILAICALGLLALLR